MTPKDELNKRMEDIEKILESWDKLFRGDIEHPEKIGILGHLRILNAKYKKLEKRMIRVEIMTFTALVLITTVHVLDVNLGHALQLLKTLTGK